MSEWEDYYQILDIDPAASEEEIRKVYRYKVLFLHPDRLRQFPERFRHRAEEQLKKINRAYNVLGDPQKRQKYHSEWLNIKNTYTVVKPKPVVDPPYITFRDVKAREAKKASFIIENIGGPYTKIWISNPDSWVKVLSWTSVTSDDELPLTVNIEAEGKDWGQIYAEYIRVKLDEEETEVKVELETKPEPVRKRVSARHISKARPTSSSSTVSPRPRTPAWLKWTGAWGLCTLFAVILWGMLTAEGPRAPPGQDSQSESTMEAKAKEVAGLTKFGVTQERDYLKVYFGLVDAQNEPITADGEARIRLYDSQENLVYEERLTFLRKEFKKGPKEYHWVIQKDKLRWPISTEWFIGEAIMYGRTALAHARAVLEVTSGKTALTTEYSQVILCSPAEMEQRIKEIYYKNSIQELQDGLNEQWPFKVAIVDYIMAGNYGWALVKRTGTEIIFNSPLNQVYNYYILYSKDQGEHWSIPWKGNSPPSFKAEFLNEREVRVITPDTIFHTRDQGMTWARVNR